MTDAPKLLPCPFCGGRARLYCDDFISGRSVDNPDWIVDCEERGEQACSANVRVYSQSVDEVIETWNRRADVPSALSADAMKRAAQMAQPATLAEPYVFWDCGYFEGVMDYRKAIDALPSPPPEALLAEALRLPQIAGLVPTEAWFRKMETYLKVYPGDKELRGMIEHARAAVAALEAKC